MQEKNHKHDNTHPYGSKWPRQQDLGKGLDVFLRFLPGERSADAAPEQGIFLYSELYFFVLQVLPVELERPHHQKIKFPIVKNPTKYMTALMHQSGAKICHNSHTKYLQDQNQFFHFSSPFPFCGLAVPLYG